MDDLDSWFDSNYQNDSQKFIEKNSLLKSLKDKIISSDKIMKLLQTKTNESTFLRKKLLNLADCLKKKERTSQELRLQVNNLIRIVELNKKVKTDHQSMLTKKDTVIEDLKHKISYIESENKIFRESSEAYLAEKSKLKELVAQKELAEKKYLLNMEKKDKRIKILTQNVENNKEMLELRQKYDSLQKEIIKLKEPNTSWPLTTQDTGFTAPPPNVQSRDDEIAHIIREMTFPNMLSPIPAEHNEGDHQNNSFCTLPDQNGCDDSSDDHFAEILETEFLKAVDVDTEVSNVQDAVMVPNDRNNSCHLLQSPQNEVHLQVKHRQIKGNGIDTAKVVCDNKNSERSYDRVNAEQSCGRTDENSKQFESVPDRTTVFTEKVLQINGPKLPLCSDNMNSADVLKSDSVTFHNVAFNYTETTPRCGEMSVDDIDVNLSAPRTCSILSEENLTKSKDNRKRNINEESLIECQNDNDKNKPNIKSGYISHNTKTNSKEIFENHIENDFSETADILKPDSVTFHKVAFNYAETTPKCVEISLGDGINANLSTPRKCSILSEEDLTKSKDIRKKNINGESLIECQNNNDKNKSNIKSGYNSHNTKTNSKEIFENHIENDFSETADILKPDSVTFHNVAFNYTETTPKCGEMSVDDIDVNLSAPRTCSILSDENLTKSKDNRERNINEESLIECQNDNDKNKPNIKSGYNSHNTKTNSKEIFENHIENDFSETADILKPDSVTFHKVAFNYAETTPKCGEISLGDGINANLSTPRKCSILSEEDLTKSKDIRKKNINGESLIECQNDNDKNKSNIKSYNTKTNSKEILENHIEKGFSQTVYDLKADSVTFHNVDFNYTETTPKSGEMSLGDEIDANLSAPRKCSILSDGNLKKFKDIRKRNINGESLIECQNDNGKNKPNINCADNSDNTKTNSKESLENHIEEYFSQTADDFKIGSVSARIPATTKDISAVDLKSTSSETYQLNLPPPNHQNVIVDFHHSQNNPQTIDIGHFKDKNLAIKNISDERSLLQEYSLSKHDKSLNLSSLFNKAEIKFNNSETKFNNSETKFNNSETKFHNSETKFNNSETKFTNSETKFHNSETKFNNSETKFNNSETKFNNSETKFNNSETKFHNSETKFNNSETKFHINNSKKANTTSISLPKISEIFISNNEMKDLDYRTSLVPNEPATLKLQEKVCTENNNENSSSEEYNDFSDDSLELDYNLSKKVDVQRNSIKSVNDGEIISKVLKEGYQSKVECVGQWIKIEHSYALETVNKEDNLTFSDSLSEQELDFSSDKCYTTKPTSLDDMFGICSSDSESEKQFAKSDIPVKSVNNMDRIETCTNSDGQNSQIFPVKVKLKELQSGEMPVPVYRIQPIPCDSFNMPQEEDSKLSNFNSKTDIENKKFTATETTQEDIKEKGKSSDEVEKATCDRTNFVNNKPLSHFKCSETFLQNSTSMLNVITSKNETVENGKINAVSSKRLGTEDVFDICLDTQKSQLGKLMDNDASHPKIFARDSNENVSSNDVLTLIKEFILVAPLITPFPDTLEFIKKYSLHTDKVNHTYPVAVPQITTKSSVENIPSPHLSINFRKRPTENSILPSNSNGNKDPIHGHDSKYTGDEPVPKSSKQQTPVKVLGLPRNLSSNQKVPNRISTKLAFKNRLLSKTRSLSRTHYPVLSKRTGQLKEFKKESHITALQTIEKLAEKRAQFESISDLKSKKAVEIKKCFVKAGGECIEDNSVATSENKLPETSIANRICKSVNQKKHKRVDVDDKPEDSTEEQLHKRQCKENRVISERTRSASHKVERELINYWKSTSSPPTGTVEKIFNSKWEPALIINTLVLQIVKLLEASQYEMVQWYYIHSNAGQPTPYLSEKETRLFHLVNLLNDRSDLNDFIPKLCDTIQKAAYNYGKESNQLGRWSLCRVYIALCRLQGQLKMARVFFYDILCQLPSSHYMLFALTVSATWPLVLTFNREDGHVTLPQVIEHVVVNSIKGKYADKKILRCLHKLCCWTLETESKKNEVPRQLLTQLQGCLNATMSKDDTFCLMKGIELLSLQENWSWTNSLIRNRIGPLLKKYLSIEEPSESVTSVLSFILEMLGNLYLHGKTRDKTVCYAVNYLLKPLLVSKKVPRQINLCCANVLLKLFPFDPGTIYPTLEIWLNENPTDMTSHLAEKWSIIKHKIGNFQNLV